MYLKQSNGISVLICTYNGANRLGKTLAHLAAQVTVDSLKWEIILIDNNSNDNTSEISKNIWQQLSCKIPFYIFKEPRPGKSFALETGVSKSNYDILIICDDDNWLQENYVQYAYDFLQKNRTVGILGSFAEPYLDSAKPLWFDKYENVFAIGRQMPQTGIANKRNYLFGAGMVIRKEIYTTVAALNHEMFLTCRKGNELSSGGDSEICLLAMQLGYDLYYDEGLQFTHYISPGRLKWSYCVEMITKGFASPQIYYAIYDYCFNAVNKNEAADFENLYRWNMRKQKRILLNEISGAGNFFSSVAALLFSKPGNDKEIRIKTAINKLRYMQKNKKQLAADFEKILALAKRMQQVKALPMEQDKQQIIQQQ
ncbi:glycosyltransferase family 2 protein [Panacibacter ginsenosidivorans]|uniref:Glycosyltransferase family 2 protein n=1 Tax=Panacibacter ginsenosidivorans TaxID=1813871 RepID=A0A5B8VCQ5_9BACT|nr:glycosyltransferase [Panacibacter ginsenosidivorans]QEC69082.1 glycosyltransferase family 2 protein [Panacibacter ginsenosidivorans]